MEGSVNKPMCLLKNFSISQKSKVESQTLSTVESCPKLSRLFFAFDFCNSLTKTTKIIKNFNICQKLWYIFDIFDIPRYMLTFALKKYKKMVKILTKLVKKDSKKGGK